MRRKSFRLNQRHQYFLWNTRVHLEAVSVSSLIQSCVRYELAAFNVFGVVKHSSYNGLVLFVKLLDR